MPILVAATVLGGVLGVLSFALRRLRRARDPHRADTLTRGATPPGSDPARRAAFFPEGRDLFGPHADPLGPGYRTPEAEVLDEAAAVALLAGQEQLSGFDARQKYSPLVEYDWGWSTSLREMVYGPGPIMVTRTGRIHRFGSIPHDYFAEFDRQWRARAKNHPR